MNNCAGRLGFTNHRGAPTGHINQPRPPPETAPSAAPHCFFSVSLHYLSFEKDPTGMATLKAGDTFPSDVVFKLASSELQ